MLSWNDVLYSETIEFSWNVSYVYHQNDAIYFKIGTCLLQNQISGKFVKNWGKWGQVVGYLQKFSLLQNYYDLLQSWILR
jgi:hypothetical protein